MSSLQYILLLEAFEKFRILAEKADFHDGRIVEIENRLFDEDPIPQPKKMRV